MKKSVKSRTSLHQKMADDPLQHDGTQEPGPGKTDGTGTPRLPSSIKLWMQSLNSSQWPSLHPSISQKLPVALPTSREARPVFVVARIFESLVKLNLLPKAPAFVTIILARYLRTSLTVP